MSLATLLKARATAPKTAADGIIVTDPAVVAAATTWLSAKRAFDAAESKKKLAEADLKPLCLDHWLTGNEQRANPESSVRIMSPEGRVTCSFQARYFPTPSNLVAIGVPAEYVCNRASIKVDIDKVPQAKQEPLAQAILKVIQEHGCDDACEIKFSEYPTAEFGAGRHRLGKEMNLRLEVAGLGTVCALRGA